MSSSAKQAPAALEDVSVDDASNTPMPELARQLGFKRESHPQASQSTPYSPAL